MPEEGVVAELTAIAAQAARAASEVLGSGAVRVAQKSGHNDIVTDHDLAAERIIEATLSAHTPGARIVGEEGTDSGAGDRDQLTWHVDPIDGTSNYAAGIPLYCISIGAAIGGRPVAGVVLDPSRDELFATGRDGIELNGDPLAPVAGGSDRESVLLASFPYEGAWFDESQLPGYGDMLRSFRAVRRLGTAALGLAWVAAGRAAAACELRTRTWDHAAGAALVLAAGGRFVSSDQQGRPSERIDQVARYVATRPGYSLENSALCQFVTGDAGRPQTEEGNV